MADPRNFGDLLAEVLSAGFDSTKYGARVLTWLNEAQRRFLRTVESPDAESSYDFSTVAGTASYALPASLLRVRSVRITTDTFTMDEMTMNDLDNSISANAKPFAFALSGDNLILYPTPDSGYSVEVRYYANQATTPDASTVPVVPPDYDDMLIAYALSKAYAFEDDPEMSAFWKNEYRGALAEARADIQKRSYVGPRQIPGMWGGL